MRNSVSVRIHLVWLNSLNPFAVSFYWYHDIPTCMAVLVTQLALTIFWLKKCPDPKCRIMGFPEMASSDAGQSAVLF